ncbi:MAG: LUD domain-containing protein [Desulfovibrio sp.]|nr:LUD domain-containing protein [Desulfovibrio sp.]
MPPVDPHLAEEFAAKAAMVNAVVQELPNMAAALTYAVDICDKKAPAEMLADEPGTAQGPLGPNKVPTRVQKVLAAPALSDDEFSRLEEDCKAKNILCLKDGLRKYLAGIDVGVSNAICGIAASGTCMVNTNGEDERLAGMISEINIIILKKSEIYPNLPAITEILRKTMDAAPGTFTTLITGPSRTADIERVAAVGVHGPLELHILLLEDQADA